MITIPVSISVDNDANGIPKGTAPYTYTISSNNPTCVSFSSSTGTIPLVDDTYTVEIDVMYATETCITTSLVNITIVDANGCSSTISPLVIDNPCDITTDITSDGEFVFVATTTGGSGSYTYDWTYDKTIFTKSTDLEDVDNSISLSLKDYKVIPTSTVIDVIVTDSNGCTKSDSYTYVFCEPTTATINISLNCNSTAVSGCTTTYSQYGNINLVPNITLCAGQELDWSTFAFNAPSHLCLVHNGNGNVTITSNSRLPKTANLTYWVKTISGVRIKTGTIVVKTPTCDEITEFSGIGDIIQLTASDIVTDVKVSPVEPRVSGTPNWSTFTFTNTPSWGTVTLNASREIEYEITNLATTPTVPDTITWSMNDYSGNQINITDVVMRNVIAAPVTVGDTICLPCGEVSSPIDILANDTGNIDRSTLTFTVVDNDITITKDTDNNIIFTVSPTVQGFNNINLYKVANSQGVFSATAIAAVVTVCSGIPDDFDLTCEISKAFDIYDRFIDPIGLNWNITETTTVAPTYTTQGGVITNPTNQGSVDFTGIDTDRTYTFQLATENTGTCPGVFDYQEVSIYHGVTPHITFGTAVDNGNGTSLYPFSYSGITSPFAITLNGSPASFQNTVNLNPVGDGGSGIFILYNVGGLNTVVMTANNKCGGAIVATDATLTI